MAKPKIVLNEAQIAEVERLAAEGATIEEIGAIFGICEKTFCEIKKRQSTVFTAYNKGRYQTKRTARKTLWQFISSGNHDSLTLEATKFWLRHQDGWTEKQTVNHTSEDRSMSPPTKLEVSFLKVNTDES